MTPRQKQTKLVALVEALKKDGFTEDRYGNFIKTNERGKYRFKIQATSVRFESQCNHGDGSKSWVKIRGAYLKDVMISADGKISGLK